MHVFVNTINANMIAFASHSGLYFSQPPHDGQEFRSQDVCCTLNTQRTDAANLWWNEERNSSIKSWISRVVITCVSTPQCHVQSVVAAQNTRCIMKEMWRSHLRIVVYPWIHYLHLMASCVHRSIVSALFPFLPLSVILTLSVTGLIQISFYAIGCNNCFTL